MNPLTHISNFRDFHEEDERILPGKLFRGGVPRNLEPEEWDYLYDLGIRHIIDLRSPEELEVNGYECDPRFHHYDWCVLMPETGITNFYFPRLINANSTPQEVYDAAWFIRKGYLLMGEYNQAFDQMFQLMLSHDEGIFFHCGSGKDRTGVFAAFVEKLLGVDDERILENYLLSNKYVIASHEKNSVFLTFPKDVIEMLRYACSVHKELLDSTFDTIYQCYPTFEDFLEKAYGLDEQKRQQLKDQYLQG